MHGDYELRDRDVLAIYAILVTLVVGTGAIVTAAFVATYRLARWIF